MKLRDWILAKKRKRRALKQQKLEQKLAQEAERKLDITDPETQPVKAEGSEPELPKTRLTEEYLEFLKQQQEAAARAADESVQEES